MERVSAIVELGTIAKLAESLLDDAALPTIVFDAEQRHVVAASPSAADWFGCPNHELLNVRLDQLVVDADKCIPESEVPGEDVTRECGLRWDAAHPRRRLVRLRWLGSPAKLGVLRWSTEELTRDASEGELETVGKLMPARVGTDGSWGAVSGALCEWLGYPPNELIAKTESELTHPQDRPHSQREMQAFLQGSQPTLHLRKRYQRASGESVWAEVNGTYLGQGEQAAGLLYIRDITEHVHPEEALRDSEEKHRSLVQNAPISILEIDLAGQILSMNPAGLAMLEVPRETDVVGSSFLDHVEVADRTKVTTFLDQALMGNAVAFDFCGQVQSHSPMLSISLLPIRNREGRITKLMGVCEDITGRLEMEKRLRESEQRFRTIFEQAAVGVALIDTHTGRFVRVNRKYESMLGYTGDELASLTYMEITSHGLEADLAQMRRLRSGEIAEFTLEKGLRKKDQETIWVSVTVSPTWHPGETPHYHIAIVQDISTRKQMEHALRTSETSLVKAQEIARVGNWQFDFATGALSGSAETYRMLGITEGDSGPQVDDVVETVVHPDDRAAVSTAVRAAIAAGVVEPLEFRHEREDGSIRHLRAVAEMLDEQEPGAPGMFGTIQDITERKETELALRESETRFRVIAEHCPAMVAIFAAGKIRFINDRVVKTLGYTAHEILGCDFLELVHPEHRDFVRERNARRLQGEDVPERYEFKLRTKSGETCWIDFTAGLFEYEGQPAVLGIAMDVTERRSTEERLRQREAELAHVARLSTMGEMVAGIAHEINQPLSAISNFADACTVELERIDHPQAAQIRQWTELIGNQAVRCGDIIRRLRSYVRQKKADDSEVAINAVIQESLALLQNELQQDLIQVEENLCDPSPKVMGNAVELQQVLVNLLANAHEAMKRSATSTGRVRVQSQPVDRQVRIEVSDNGPGLEDAQIDRLFEAFYTTKSDGMGMGLAISRSIIERHGGRLWAEDNPSGGARFFIELPISTGVKRVLIG